jgi:hypothetical protein
VTPGPAWRRCAAICRNGQPCPWYAVSATASYCHRHARALVGRKLPAPRQHHPPRRRTLTRDAAQHARAAKETTRLAHAIAAWRPGRRCPVCYGLPHRVDGDSCHVCGQLHRVDRVDIADHTRTREDRRPLPFA